mgnify:FL=1
MKKISQLTKITIPRADLLGEFKHTHTELIAFVRSQLKESKSIKDGTTGDYGIIPGTKKRSLLKPGAEKLLKLFGFTAVNELVKEVEDFDKGFVYYKYKCTVRHGASGIVMADATRTSNNKEANFIRQGKTAYDLANNVEAKAQKRALVAATVQATMATEIFETGEGDFEDDPPGRSVNRDEDPNRIRTLSAYFAAASSRGIDQDQAKNVIKKKLNVTSMKDISTADVRRFTDALIATFRVVKEGEKPQKFTDAVSDEKPDAAPVELKPYCHNLKNHGGKNFPIKEGSWCSDACRDDYWNSRQNQSKNRLDVFIKSGKFPPKPGEPIQGHL